MNGGRPGHPKMHPAVGWAVLHSNQLREKAVTIRWERGDRKAYVLAGERLGEHGTARVLDVINVDHAGWTDLAEVRLVGQTWLHTYLARGAAS